MDPKLQILLTAKDMTAQGFGAVQARIKSLTGSMLSFRGVMAGIGAATSFAYVTKQALNTADATAKLADSIGLGTKALQEYRYIGERSGVTTDALDKSLEQFTKRMGDLRVGTGALASYLEKTDEAFLAQLQSVRSNDEALNLLMQRMGQIDNANDKAALSTAAFGRSGVAMTNIVKGGAAELEALRKRFRDLGLEIDERLLRSSEAANDAIFDLQSVLSTTYKSTLIQLAPSIQKAATETANWVAANRELLTQGIEQFFSGLASTAAATWPAIQQIGGAIRDMVTGFSSLPAWVQQVGIVGGFLFGAKGMAAVALLSTAAGSLKRITDEINNIETTTITKALIEKEMREIEGIEQRIAKLRGSEKSYWEPIYREQIAQRQARMDAMREEIAGMEQAKSAFDGFSEEIMDAAAKINTTSIIPKVGMDPKLDEAARKAREAIEAVIWSLNEQIDVFGESEQAATLYRMSLMEGVTPAQLEMANALLGNLEHLREQQSLMLEGKRVFESVMTSAEHYTATVDRLNQLQDAGAISAETYARAVKQAADAYAGINNKAEEAADHMKDAFMGWASNFSSMLTDAVWNAEFSFDQILESFGKMLTQMVIQKRIVEPLFNWGFGGGSTAPTASAYANTSGGYLGVAADIYHAGGTVGYGARTQRIVAASMFDHAPRLHNGLRSGEFPAILERGEEVTPRHQVGRGGSGVVNNIYISGGSAKPKVEQQPNNTGGMDVFVMFDEAQGAAIRSRRGATFHAIKDVFGAQPALARR